MSSEGVFPHIGREQTLTALGREWTLGRKTAGVWARVWEWVKTRLPDQFAGLERFATTMPPEQYAQLVSDAMARHRAMNSIECDEAQRLLATIEGGVTQFIECLREHHPDIDFEIAVEILAEIGQAEAERLQRKAEGEYPPAPKVEAPAA